jgi:hypothetical protein
MSTAHYSLYVFQKKYWLITYNLNKNFSSWFMSPCTQVALIHPSSTFLTYSFRFILKFKCFPQHFVFKYFFPPHNKDTPFPFKQNDFIKEIRRVFDRASLMICRVKIQLDATQWFIELTILSTCFGHYYAHHQELETIQVITACSSSNIPQPGRIAQSPTPNHPTSFKQRVTCHVL